MKKLLLFAFTMLSLAGFSQAIIVDVLSPGSISGTVPMEVANDGGQGGWGADMSIAANNVTGDVVIVSDGSAADSLGCNALSGGNGAAVSGNIAMVYRGSCEFGTKSLNAQTAGAIAVIIVNNVAGAPVPMGGGVDGGSVNIPVVMISQTDGADIRQEIDNGNTVNVFIGTKFGLFNDDIGTSIGNVTHAASFSMPEFVANANNFSITQPGANVFNYGNNTQTDVVLTCTIELSGTTIYNESSQPTTIASSDTVGIDLPDFTQTTYDPGYYTMTYTLTYSATDEDPSDNEIVTNFYINDRYYSKSRFDSNGDPISDATVGVNDNISSFRSCIVVRESQADSLPLYKVGFSLTTDTSEIPTLEGTFVDVEVWEWNDNIPPSASTAANPVTFNALTELSKDTYTFQSDLQGEFVEQYVNGAQGLQLSNGVDYLVCVRVFEYGIRVGYDSGINYNRTGAVIDEWTTPVSTTETGTTDWFAGGFTSGNVPSIYLVMGGDAVASTEDVEVKEAEVYPNPAVNYMLVPVKAGENNVTVQIIDMAGKVVLEDIINPTSEKAKLNVTNVETGRYLLNVKYNDGSTRQHNIVITQ